MLSQKSLQVHVLIFKLPVLGAQGGVEKDLALLLLVSTVPRDLVFIRSRASASMPWILTIVPAMSKATNCTNPGLLFGAGVQTNSYIH